MPVWYVPNDAASSGSSLGKERGGGKKCKGERKEAGKVSNYPRQLRSRRHAKIVSLHDLEASAIEEANPVDI